MATLPQSSVPYRSPRAQLAPMTPAVLRFADGHQSRGELCVISLTGGLLSLPKAVDPGCRVKLLFMTQAGSVFAPAEMLRPVSWVLQPFRFLSLEEGDQRKVQATVHSFLGQSGAGDDWVDRYRARLTNHKPSQKRFSKIAVVVLALATVCFGSALYFCGVFVR